MKFESWLTIYLPVKSRGVSHEVGGWGGSNLKLPTGGAANGNPWNE